MKSLLTALLLCLAFTINAQIERPLYNVKETYKPDVEGHYVLSSLRTTRGGLAILITETSISETKLDVFTGQPVKTIYYEIVDVENKDGRYSYRVLKDNQIYYFEYHEGVMDEYLLKTPEGEIFIFTGDVSLKVQNESNN